jgi:methionine sulfoxide reductase catalytic subunit
MLIKTRAELPSSEITPEALYVNRRAFMRAALAAGAGAALAGGESAVVVGAADPMKNVWPLTGAAKSPFSTTEKQNSFEDITTYNNFYEFGLDKDIVKAAQALPLRPWTIKIDGMVEQPQTLDIDDLLKKVSLEERLYRHRCVEAWSFTVPWTGFPMKALLDIAKPLGSAKYVRMETFMDPATAPEQKKFFYPWPYTEGLTMAEAANELTFLVTGMYGKPVPKQDGAPLRLATPWKYGFKSIKSIVRFEFTDKRPKSYWEALQASEYGFWANVNPEVPHPRWSQATERVLGTDERRPTLMWNGYGEFVADMYKGLEKERLFV